MRCNDFDAHIDEMLSGILHPDANLHMRQCERCTSHLRSRTAVQKGLRQLASATLSGPSRATDRAVMDGFRRLQHRRAVAGSSAPAAAALAQDAAQNTRLLTFPIRRPAPARHSRSWMSGAAAVVAFAVLGSALHLWTGVPTVNAPTVPAAAPASAAAGLSVPAERATAPVAALNLTARRTAPPRLSRSNASQSNASQTEAPVLRLVSSRAPVAGDANAVSPMPLPASVPQVMRLASAGTAQGTNQATVNSMVQSASSTWPGYSNLVYCDPVVCSGPMQVIHIKVPVGQVKPNVGQSVGNGFVNAEVVIGPDGVARAIRVAN